MSGRASSDGAASGRSAATRAAIVLAAGRGERMGGPKGLLLVGGAPLVALHAARFAAAGCGPVVVVAHDDVATWLDTTGGEVFDEDTRARLRVVVSHEPEPRGSLAIGVRALAAGAPGLLGGASRVLVTPVDALPSAPATIEALLRALDGADAATPTRAGRGGHPIACRAEVLARYLDGAPGETPTLRDRLAALGPRRVRVPVDDGAIAVDLDDPDDLHPWTGARPSFARTR